MLAYVPFLGWISAELVVPFLVMGLPVGGWGAKVSYGKYADRRDMEKLYAWLLANTGPKMDYYDIDSLALASSIGLPVEREEASVSYIPKSNRLTRDCLTRGGFMSMTRIYATSKNDNRAGLMKTPAVSEAHRHLVRLESEAREAYRNATQGFEIFF